MSAIREGRPQSALDWGDTYEPPRAAPDESGDVDPLGGRPRESKAAGGLNTLWRRFNERVEQSRRARELNDLSRESVHVVGPARETETNEENTP